MPNKARGEAELIAGGKAFHLLLTLGALAEIEDGLGLENLAGVAERLKRARSADLAIVAAALLRGGGHDVTPAQVLALECDLASLVEAVGEAFARAGLERESDARAEANEVSGPFSGAICLRSDLDE